MIFLLGVPVIGVLFIRFFVGKGKKSPTKGEWMLAVILFLSMSVIGVGQYRDDCLKTYPNPQIKFDHIDSDGRVYIPVTNWSAYDNEMFRQAPDLPPCGANTKSARTWVNIFNAVTNAQIYGFCALGSNADLEINWFKSYAKGGQVYIILDDRACKKQYKSNILAWPL